MFFDDSLKGLKKELKAVGADMSYVKNWQKTYDKVKKQSSIIKEQYIQAQKELQVVDTILKEMEQIFVSYKDESDLKNVQKSLSGFAKEMKQYQNHFNHEFLIGEEDKEFHLTYSTIVSLCEKNIKEKKESLIIQSEVENLLAITKEALEKKWPEYRAMAYFYLEHSDREIFELPHSEKIEMVEKIYKDEFYNPMGQVLEDALGAERTRNIMEIELWN